MNSLLVFKKIQVQTLIGLRIEGGPTKPNVTNMTDMEAARTLKKYKIARKKYTDSVHSERVKLAQLAENYNMFKLTGDNSDCICLMEIVEQR